MRAPASMVPARGAKLEEATARRRASAVGAINLSGRAAIALMTDDRRSTLPQLPIGDRRSSLGLMLARLSHRGDLQFFWPVVWARGLPQAIWRNALEKAIPALEDRECDQLLA
jgi:hypothetical protein